MNIKNYIGGGLATLALAGSLFLNGCGESRPHRPSRLENRLNQEQAAQNHTLDKYATLISGNVDDRDMYDLSMVYQVLLENGFKKENIYILDKNGEKTALYPVDDRATKESLETLYFHLGKKIDEEDLLFIYLTDHGNRTTYKPKGDEKGEKIKVSEVVLPCHNLNEIELKKMLDPIGSKTTIVLADICYGGGFANRFSTGQYVGISSSLEDEAAHGNTEHMFSRYFVEAYRVPTESDKNRDGSVSLKEAFEYAKQNHPWTRDGDDTPVLKSELDLERLTLE